MMAESKGHASSYIMDLMAFLQSTFMSFTNLPVSWKILFIIFTFIIYSIISLVGSWVGKNEYVLGNKQMSAFAKVGRFMIQ